jgi:hypothetical protein
MKFDWKDFLDLARYLLAQLETDPAIPQEATFRCAIGRAYYAAYGYTRNYAIDWLGFQRKTKLEEKSQEHGALRNFLKLKRRRNIAERLESLRTWRNICDYEDNLQDLQFPEDLAAALNDADFIFRNLEPPKKNRGGGAP